MKKLIVKIMMGLVFLGIGYNVAEVFTPQKAGASQPIILEGRWSFYPWIITCICPRTSPNCVCIIDRK